MTIASFLARLHRAKRMSQPRVTIHLYVFTEDDRVAVEIMQPHRV